MKLVLDLLRYIFPKVLFKDNNLDKIYTPTGLPVSHTVVLDTKNHKNIEQEMQTDLFAQIFFGLS